MLDIRFLLLNERLAFETLIQFDLQTINFKRMHYLKTSEIYNV